MKKAFIHAYKRIMSASAREARRAWKTCDEGTRLAIIAMG